MWPNERQDKVGALPKLFYERLIWWALKCQKYPLQLNPEDNKQ
jgi:hypothetical protein